MEFKGRSRIDFHLDMAPLIDVVFLLLVFFMLTSTFLIPESVDLSLPESRSADVLEQSPIAITLDQEGRLTLNGETILLKTLQERIKPLLENKPENSVTLKSDAGAKVQSLLKVMDEIRAAGGRDIALATSPSSLP